MHCINHNSVLNYAHRYLMKVKTYCSCQRDVTTSDWLKSIVTGHLNMPFGQVSSNWCHINRILILEIVYVNLL